MLLLGAAVGAVLTQREALDRLVDSARQAPWWLVAAIVVLPLLNWLAIATSLWMLTLRYGRVSLPEMITLVGSAWLLNFLPMRPGLVTRLAYHKRVNGIRVRDSAKVLVQSVVLAAVACATLLVAALAAEALAVHVALTAAVPLALAGLAGLVVARFRRDAALLVGAGAMRYADLLLWVARYAAVFALIASPLGVVETVLVTSISQIAMLVPFTGAGMGLREWAVGISAEQLGGALDLALAADLLNRAAEIAAAIPVGLACTALAARWMHRRRHAARPDAPAAG